MLVQGERGTSEPISDERGDSELRKWLYYRPLFQKSEANNFLAESVPF